MGVKCFKKELDLAQVENIKLLRGRIGRPEDTAKLVNFLVSEEAEWITGEIINSEGGFRR